MLYFEVLFIFCYCFLMVYFLGLFFESSNLILEKSKDKSQSNNFDFCLSFFCLIFAFQYPPVSVLPVLSQSLSQFTSCVSLVLFW